MTAEDMAEIQRRTPIVDLVSNYTDLTRSGPGELEGICPLEPDLPHNDPPLLRVARATGLWRCYGCGLNGDIFDFATHITGQHPPASARRLARRCGVEPPASARE